MAGLLLGAEADLPDDLVFCDGTVTTRVELVDRVTQLATVLREGGLQPGQVVVSLLPDGPDAIAAWFGIWAADGVAAPVNPRLATAEIDRIVASLEPVAVLRTAADLAAPAMSKGGAPHDDDVALILTTSGTTGQPKPVELRHAATVEGLDTVLAKLRGEGQKADRARMPNLIPVSLSLWAGVYNVLFSFRAGNPVVLLPKFDPIGFASIVAEHRIRSTVLPPAMIAMLTDSDVSDLSLLKMVRSISSPLSPTQARRFHDKFDISVLNSYGQTELGGEVIGWSSSDVKEFGDDKLGAIGRPHGGIEIRFDDDELCVRSPYMMKGYADGAVAGEMNDRLTDDGFLRTGDLGHLDEDGFVWLTGRVSDVINRGGLKVFPADVEEVVLQHPSIREAAVVGVRDDRLGEVPWAVVVASFEVDDAELDAICREQLAPYKVPARFVFVEKLPRNEVGKVLRTDLAARAKP
jgi:acyl-CoA synthetase (AMP-forming)/AMP-acid ligase II